MGVTTLWWTALILGIVLLHPLVSLPLAKSQDGDHQMATPKTETGIVTTPASYMETTKLQFGESLNKTA